MQATKSTRIIRQMYANAEDLSFVCVENTAKAASAMQKVMRIVRNPAVKTSPGGESTQGYARITAMLRVYLVPTNSTKLR